MGLSCLSCAAPVEPDNVAAAVRLAKCGACDAVFYSGAVSTALPEIVLDRSLKLSESDSEIVFGWRWFTRQALIGVIACFFLQFLAFAPTAGVILEKRYDVLWVTSPLVLLALAFSYVTLAHLLNRTTATFSRDWITVRHGPLPWRGLRVPAGGIVRLEALVNRRRRRMFTGHPMLEIVGVTEDGKRVKLVRDLPEAELAFMIKRKVDAFLGSPPSASASPGSSRAVVIRCRECDAAIRAGNLTLEDLTAWCGVCGAVFDFERQLRSPRSAPSTAPDVPLPSDFSVEQLSGRIVVSWVPTLAGLLGPWGAYLLYFLACFSIWPPIDAFRKSKPLPQPLVVFSVLGISFLAYVLLARVFTRARLTVTPESISLRYGPLPWFRARSLPRNGLRQIFCASNHLVSVKGGRIASYEVHAIRSDHRRVALVVGLEDVRQANFLERKIEGLLGIPDLPVRGELPRLP